MKFFLAGLIFLNGVALEAAFVPLDLLPQIVQEGTREQAAKNEAKNDTKSETKSEVDSSLPGLKEIIESKIQKEEPQNKKPLRQLPHVSRMPHIPLQKPLELQDRGMFMSHPHPQQPTLPDSAVFPPTTKKNTG